MALRDHLAARAPPEIASWFEPVMPNPCPKIIWRNGEGVEWPDGELPEGATGPAININSEAIGEWWRLYYKLAPLQWPYAWADAVIAEDQRLQGIHNAKDSQTQG